MARTAIPEFLAKATCVAVTRAACAARAKWHGCDDSVDRILLKLLVQP